MMARCVAALLQVHEMVLVEKGGMDQFKDEIEAYNPLIPQGDNLGTSLGLARVPTWFLVNEWDCGLQRW